MSGTGRSGSSRRPGAPIQIRESSHTSRPSLSPPRRFARIRSSRPAASRAWSVPDSSTVSSRSTSGCSRRNDSRISGSRVVTKSSDAPKRSRPRSRVPPKNATARSCACRIVRAKPSIASPSSVSATRCVSRANNGRPVASSRRRTCWLTVDWRSPRRSAARVKLSVWATARKVRSCVGSYTRRPYRPGPALIANRDDSQSPVRDFRSPPAGPGWTGATHLLADHPRRALQWSP